MSLCSKVVDDIAFEVDCQTITVKEGDVDIGMSFLFLFFFLSLPLIQHLIFPLGANPSAEEQDESVEDGAKTVNNVVHSFRLQPSAFDKKSYLAYLKVTMPIYLVQAFGDVASL